MTRNTSAEKTWDWVAPRWIEFIRNSTSTEGGLSRKHMLNPVLFDLLGDVDGRSIIDIGCGEGYLSRIMAERGAIVTGMDISGAMLAAARSATRREGLEIDYIQGNMNDPPASLLNKFDLAVCNAVLNVVPDHERAFRFCLAVIKRRGSLVVSIMHPGFDGVGSGWIETKDGERRWSANRYFERVVGTSANGVPSYHRCLSDYITAALDAGGTLTAFQEPIFAGDFERSLPPQQRAYTRIPTAAVFRLQKA